MIKKNSLGKGLGAMFPDLLEKIGDKPVLLTCGIEELVPNRYQARKDFDPEEHKSLVASIRESGIIQPIVARKFDGGYEIIAGERRWRATQEAGLKNVPVIVRDAADQDAAVVFTGTDGQSDAFGEVGVKLFGAVRCLAQVADFEPGAGPQVGKQGGDQRQAGAVSGDGKFHGKALSKKRVFISAGKCNTFVFQQQQLYLRCVFARNARRRSGHSGSRMRAPALTLPMLITGGG